MAQDADKFGAQVTLQHDPRITRVGRVLRKYRLDEISQLIDILRGAMTFVGTRPEVPKYVDAYTPEMLATFLLPAGVTSEASVRYKDEDALLQDSRTADEVYVDAILPAKMEWNLAYIRNFSLMGDLRVLLETVAAVTGLRRHTADDIREYDSHL